MNNLKKSIAIFLIISTSYTVAMQNDREPLAYQVSGLRSEMEELKVGLKIMRETQEMMRVDLKEFIDLAKTLEAIITCQREEQQQLQEEEKNEQSPNNDWHENKKSKKKRKNKNGNH